MSAPDSEATLETVVGERTVLVDGGEARAFDKGTLLAVFRNYDAVRHHGWLEAFVSSHTAATHSSVWWVSGVDGWDFLLTLPKNVRPSAELHERASSVVEWKPHARLPAEDKTDGISEEDKTDG